MLIRPAVPDDAEALFRLNREFNGDDTADAAMIRRQLICPGPEVCLVCVDDGEITGFACGICFQSLCYTRPVAQITELYVQPSARRCGAGTALIRSMTALLREAGAAEILLLTGDDNIPAQSLYEKCGFIREDERCYQLNID